MTEPVFFLLNFLKWIIGRSFIAPETKVKQVIKKTILVRQSYPKFYTLVFYARLIETYWRWNGKSFCGFSNPWGHRSMVYMVFLLKIPLSSTLLEWRIWTIWFQIDAKLDVGHFELSPNYFFQRFQQNKKF